MENNANNRVMNVQSQVAQLSPMDEEETIDLREIFYAIKKRLLLIIAIGLLFGVIAAAITMFLMTPTYTSTSSMLVISKETTLTSIADLQLGTQLTKDYRVLITTTSVLEEVIDNLGIDATPESLRRSLTVNNPSDTRILEISARNSDPEMAKKIVDNVANVGALYIADKMEVIPPKIIEVGKIPTVQTSPSVKRNVMIGVLLGLVLSGGIVAAMSIMDDTIKTEEDITRYLELSLLASIPDRKDYIYSNKKGKKKKSA